MNSNIISSTDVQRDIKGVLNRLNKSSEPLVVVRDSKPAAVLLPLGEFRRLSNLEKEIIKMQMEKVWADMRLRNKNVPEEDIDRAIEEAKSHAKHSR